MRQISVERDTQVAASIPSVCVHEQPKLANGFLRVSSPQLLIPKHIIPNASALVIHVSVFNNHAPTVVAGR